ncbi:growth factor receptor-bound protein 10 isoform X1 [Tachysurus vachellii]|uniref:growth factor receptor-bound protein 10 isoform X1 n=1 Tax=Tachysurus vachellii TaxID=175792 RepID=UPI00296B3F0D|nr:growth factor receptor-bound protein 10 isoform X1 [Tachysurus vachellii]XP_060727175.1 growth factor receptor-bound protein 10 isoform X1 [Tachysurus vachellii]XP_060727176.1 growth factor receptor-bound protein 10 isoform X1 [Tachysurus vachellii]XP_060727177.1 growth factor receptor-bound protein 10 isoform X1 [Tachysurus vachellii]
MAVAGCPDYFLHHPNYQQDNVDRTANHRPANLIGSSFQQAASRTSPNHQVSEDDVDLEALVNDMNSSFESLYPVGSVQCESVPLLHNGQHTHAHTHTQPISPHQRLRRSQPMHILAVRRLQEEAQQFQTSSLPAIPNPFPELCSPAGSPTACPGSLPSCQTSEKHIVKVFGEDGMGKVVEIPSDMTARDLCQLLVYKSHCVDDNSWALVEHHPALGLERCLEDHELVAQVQASMTSESKFVFRKNYAKYEFFKNPLNFFPEQMVAWCQESNGTIPPSQLLQNFLNSSSCPEIQGYLYVKETGRKSWKKLYVFLRRSGLYYSTKGTSKEPRHLQLLADLEDSNIFTVIAGKKLHNAPTEYEFCIKPNKVRSEQKELRMLCAEDEQSRTCWMTAFRLFKYGILLYQNYKFPQQRKALLSHFPAPMRSVSENSLVAMDFSGTIGRVINNPVEAQSAALEEAHAWRKRSQRMNTLGSPSPLHPSSLSGVIHKTQLWFHGRITREESHRLMHQQGQVDGLFLLRDSQSNPKAFVLTMCHHQKIKHFQILLCEEDGHMFFSLDDGTTKFTDLIQLVEFYQLNRGVLPCKLKHPCTMVAL